MYSGARNASGVLKSSIQKDKYVRCKDCANAVPYTEDKVMCKFVGEMPKTNSCIRRKAK